MTMPSPDAYRAAIGSFPTGVAVVSAIADGEPAGLTTNALSSLSLDPMLLLVCVDRESRTLPVIRAARRFAVNLLRDDQEPLARVFASKQLPREKFEQVTHTVAHDVPVLDGALAWFACDLEAEHDGGDHVIVVGRVTTLKHDAGAAPLRYERGTFS